MQVGGLLSGVETGELFTCATSPDERAGRAGTSTCHPSHTPPSPSPTPPSLTPPPTPSHPPSNPSLSHHRLSPPFPNPRHLLTSTASTAAVGYSPFNQLFKHCFCLDVFRIDPSLFLYMDYSIMTREVNKKRITWVQ